MFPLPFPNLQFFSTGTPQMALLHLAHLRYLSPLSLTRQDPPGTTSSKNTPEGTRYLLGAPTASKLPSAPSLTQSVSGISGNSISQRYLEMWNLGLHPGLPKAELQFNNILR